MRPYHHLAGNDCAEIADALDLAIRAKSDRSAVAILVGLSGISVPIASAILTVLMPNRFTVIDFRALESLGVRRTVTDRSIGFYLKYLNFCRSLAAERGVSLRELDRALWQWSKNRAGRR